MQRKSLSRQRAAVIITALLFMVLASTLALLILTRQSNSTKRLQLIKNDAWYRAAHERAFVEAKRRLMQHYRKYPITTLHQAWAQPWRFKFDVNGAVEATLSDAMAYFNINNLSYVTPPGPDKHTARAIVARLLNQQQAINSRQRTELNTLLSLWLLPANAAAASGQRDFAVQFTVAGHRVTAPRMPIMSITELAVLPILTPASLQQLMACLTALPLQPRSKTGLSPTRININTTTPDILAAVADMPQSVAGAILIQRPFGKVAELDTLLQRSVKRTSQQPRRRVFDTKHWFDVTSHFFILHSVASLHEAQQSCYWLLQVSEKTGVSIVWQSIGAKL